MRSKTADALVSDRSAFHDSFPSLWWTESSGLDGFRLDTVPYSSRRSWSLWHEAMRQVYPGLRTIGELSDLDATITSFFEGGCSQFDGADSGITTISDYPLYCALRDVLIRGAPVQKFLGPARRGWKALR